MDQLIFSFDVTKYNKVRKEGYSPSGWRRRGNKGKRWHIHTQEAEKNECRYFLPYIGDLDHFTELTFRVVPPTSINQV